MNGRDITKTQQHLIYAGIIVFLLLYLTPGILSVIAMVKYIIN